MTNYQKAVESACSKCPMQEKGCRSVCPVFRRALNKARRESHSLTRTTMTPEEIAKMKLCRAIIREARKINARGYGNINFVVRKEIG